MLQILVNGLIAGAMYALVAAGFSLVFSTNKFVHFAHGAVVTVGGYALFSFFHILQLDFWLSVVLAVLATALTGFLLNELVYKRLRARKGFRNPPCCSSMTHMGRGFTTSF